MATSLENMSAAQLEALKREARLELARRDFWEYCKLKAPDFYMESHDYIKYFCHELQDFYESDDQVMIVNMPPRHGKSRTAQLFVEWILGNHPNEKIMTGSYNEALSTTFSRGVRNAIQERKAKGSDRIVFSDIFPGVRIKRGDGAASLWALEGQHATYLATSPSGTATGFGCSLLIIDDLIKLAEEAFNEDALEKQWNWFTQTMLSRREKGAKIIIIMTRWSTMDLAGRALEHYERVGARMRHINFKALQDDGTMLCDDVLDRESFELNKEAQGAAIVAANYQQEPLDEQGRLYSGFHTYKPSDAPSFDIICCYTDTADRGDDNLASIIYGVSGNDCYVLDVYYTPEVMEITEPETAKRLYEYKVQKWLCESNNGGRGFGRSVERILRDKYHTYRIYIDLFYQSKNKKARILGASTWVQQHVIFPEGWEFKYPEFYKEIMTYTKDGKPKHDDGCDALTGLYEKVGRGNVFDFT